MKSDIRKVSKKSDASQRNTLRHSAIFILNEKNQGVASALLWESEKEDPAFDLGDDLSLQRNIFSIQFQIVLFQPFEALFDFRIRSCLGPGPDRFRDPLFCIVEMGAFVPKERL